MFIFVVVVEGYFGLVEINGVFFSVDVIEFFEFGLFNILENMVVSFGCDVGGVFMCVWWVRL